VKRTNLNRIFYAGARRIISSLWKFDIFRDSGRRSGMSFQGETNKFEPDFFKKDKNVFDKIVD